MGKCEPSASHAKFKAEHICFIPAMCSVAPESIIQGNEEEEYWKKHVYPTALTVVWQKMMIPHCKKINYEGLLALSWAYEQLFPNQSDFLLWRTVSWVFHPAVLFIDSRIFFGWATSYEPVSLVCLALPQSEHTNLSFFSKVSDRLLSLLPSHLCCKRNLWQRGNLFYFSMQPLFHHSEWHNFLVEMENMHQFSSIERIMTLMSFFPLSLSLVKYKEGHLSLSLSLSLFFLVYFFSSSLLGFF